MVDQEILKGVPTGLKGSMFQWFPGDLTIYIIKLIFRAYKGGDMPMIKSANTLNSKQRITTMWTI